MPQQIHPTCRYALPLRLHKIIKNTGRYNFEEVQNTLNSQLNPDIWDSLRKNYWDEQLCLLIRFGFPLDFNRLAPLQSHEENDFSAKTYLEDVQAYLQEEIKHKAILGPFDQPPLPDLHVSPFMTREKPNAPHRRVIVDLSFPHGKSVNAGIQKDIYLGTPFLLKLPTIDTITDQIKKLGKGCMLYKVDVSQAFRHVKLYPSEYARVMSLQLVRRHLPAFGV